MTSRARAWTCVVHDVSVRVFLRAVATLVFLSFWCGCADQGPEDAIPPARVIDLAVEGRSTCSMDLIWTAVGDDGLTGRASGYDLRYSTSAVTDASWPGAAQCQGEPSPSDAGGQEHFSVTGLAAGTKYYFRLATADDNCNVSGLSNVPTSETDSAGASPGVAWVRDGLGSEDLDWTNAVSGLSATWAAMSGATGYEYAIGSTVGAADVVDWRAVLGAGTTVNHGEIDLVEGNAYYFSVRALLEGGCSGHGVSDGITVDRTPPESHVRALPAEVSGLGLKVTWTGSDGGSGIADYDVQSRDAEAGAWADWLVGTSDTAAVLEPEDGHTYFFRARARDSAGNREDYPDAADAQTMFTYEMTQVAWVKDGLGPEDEDFTASASEISATWAAVNGADGYEYALGANAGVADVVTWTPAGADTAIARGGLAPVRLPHLLLPGARAQGLQRFRSGVLRRRNR